MRKFNKFPTYIFKWSACQFSFATQTLSISMKHSISGNLYTKFPLYLIAFIYTTCRTLLLYTYFEGKHKIRPELTMGQCQYQLAMVTLDIIQFLLVTIAVTMLNQTDIFLNAISPEIYCFSVRGIFIGFYII